jgi:primosomal protein N' (replication factor Y)
MLSEQARSARRGQTDAERRLWFALRSRRLAGYKFRRQHSIGGFVVDFACTKYRLVIEADGGQHAENQRDERRTAVLEALGWRVLRFWNNDILGNTGGVVATILQELGRLEAPSPASGLRPEAPSPAVQERDATIRRGGGNAR